MRDRVTSAVRRVALVTRLYAPMKAVRDWRWKRRRRQLGTYAQFGEDREILTRLGPSGRYADVGANHPFKSSNTYLLYLAGWEGLTIEPIRSLYDQHRRLRPRDVALNAAAGRRAGTAEFHELRPAALSTFDLEAAHELVSRHQAVRVASYPVQLVRLADAWRAAYGERAPDLLSIDTEGFEAEVLAGADLDHLAPRMVLLELSTATDKGPRRSLIDVMEAHGYELVDEFGVNALFTRGDRSDTEGGERRSPTVESPG